MGINKSDMAAAVMIRPIGLVLDLALLEQEDGVYLVKRRVRKAVAKRCTKSKGR
jgi:hypothetical protein